MAHHRPNRLRRNHRLDKIGIIMDTHHNIPDADGTIAMIIEGETPRYKKVIVQCLRHWSVAFFIGHFLSQFQPLFPENLSDRGHKNRRLIPRAMSPLGEPSPRRLNQRASNSLPTSVWPWSPSGTNDKPIPLTGSSRSV